jgi:hypothetical protein
MLLHAYGGILFGWFTQQVDVLHVRMGKNSSQVAPRPSDPGGDFLYPASPPPYSLLLAIGGGSGDVLLI